MPKRDARADLALCNAASPGPWYPRATDDENSASACYISTQECPTVSPRRGQPWPNHDHIQGMGRDAEPWKAIAITLLQYPPLAVSDDEKWDENTEFIAIAREALPHYIQLSEAFRKLAEAYRGLWLQDNNFFGQGIEEHERLKAERDEAIAEIERLEGEADAGA